MHCCCFLFVVVLYFGFVYAVFQQIGYVICCLKGRIQTKNKQTLSDEKSEIVYKAHSVCVCVCVCVCVVCCVCACVCVVPQRCLILHLCVYDDVYRCVCVCVGGGGGVARGRVAWSFYD